MRREVSASLFACVVSLVGSTAEAQVSIGVTIGQPPPAPVVYRVPPQPAPEFVWVEGYWYPHGHKYRWHDGYWTQAPFAGAYWVAPYYTGGRYYAGYWESGPKRVEHDHRWDHDHDRRDGGRDRERR